MSDSEILDAINNVTSALNKGDLDTMMKHFEQDATLVIEALPGQDIKLAKGKKAIRNGYTDFFVIKPNLERITQRVIESDDYAVHFSNWKLTVTLPDGKKQESTGTSTDVLKKQSNGKWLISVYNPFGPKVLETK